MICPRPVRCWSYFRGSKLLLVTVCQAAFASLHGVSKVRIRRLAFASLQSTFAPVDKCGKHTSRPHKILRFLQRQIDDHICSSFPAMKSHYSRQRLSCCCKYLSPKLSVAQIHTLKYEEDPEKSIVSYDYYLKENFKLSFGYPKTDICGYTVCTWRIW